MIFFSLSFCLAESRKINQKNGYPFNCFDCYLALKVERLSDLLIQISIFNVRLCLVECFIRLLQYEGHFLNDFWWPETIMR